MVESQQVLEWMAEGEVKRQIKDLLRLLASRFPSGVPADLLARIQGTTDLQKLDRWYEEALRVSSLDDFRRLVEA